MRKPADPKQTLPPRMQTLTLLPYAIGEQTKNIQGGKT
jgi:hypothetical protein